MSDKSLSEGLSLNGYSEVVKGRPSTNFDKEVKKDWESFFIEENPQYGKIDNLDISEKISELKDRYPQLLKFKKIAQLGAGFFHISAFIKYAKNNHRECKDVVLDGSHFENWDAASDEMPYFKTLTILNSDFGFVYRRNGINDEPSILLFFNDEKYIHEKFYKEEDLKYAPGIYELGVDGNGNYHLKKVSINYLSKPILDEKLSERLNVDITCFFENESFYRDNPVEILPYKRGIIIYGPHGNGKTTFIKHTLGEYKNTYRLLIDSGMHFSPELFDFINHVFPEKGKKIIVFEDVESISQGNEGRSYAKRSSFLNFIDGPKTMESTMFLATTNHIDLVDEALADRPSRFDKRYRIGLPSPKSRSRFLVKFFPELKKNKARLKELVLSTKYFSGAYFKELFIMVGIQRSSLEEAVFNLSKQIKNFKEKNFDPKSSRSIGLNIEEDDYWDDDCWDEEL